MRKISALLIMDILIFSLSACGSEISSQQPETAATAGAESSVPADTETMSGGSDKQIPESSEETNANHSDNADDSEEDTVMKMNVQAGDSVFTATLEENNAADAFVKLMKEAPVVIQMRDYSGFEKVGSLGTSLPASNSQTTTHAGDIVLYNGSQIVIFYGSNSWSYTRLGKIDDLAGWEEALGSGDVTVTFSLE